MDEFIFGTPNPDLLNGLPINSIISGLGGADTIFGNQGADQLSGGDGNDLIDGGQGIDIINGGIGNDILHGGEDADEIFGSQDNDVIFGDLGSDKLTGGAGADKFVFERVSGAATSTTGGPNFSDADRIMDFTKGSDLIGLGGGLSFQDLDFILVTRALDSTGTFVNSTVIRDRLTGEYLGVLRAIQPNQLTESDFTTDLTPVGTFRPDLTIAKRDSADPIRVGDPLVYTLTVSNNGTAAASNVTVQDTLPTGFVPGATTVSNGFTASTSGQTVTFTGGSIAAGGSTTLTIAVSTTTATVGTKSNTARVDPLNAIAESNETNNSVTETTRVDAAPALTPEINVTDGGFGGTTDNITDGDTTPISADGTDYGSTVVGTPVTRTFTIENTGTGALTLSAPTLPTGFSPIGAFPTSIPAGNNATFTVRLNATTAGTFSGNISFGNNDSNENPYNFAVTGAVSAAPTPEINVTDGGFGGTTDNIADGDTTPSTTDGTNFGSTTAGTAVTRTFTIENAGTADLTLSAPTLPTGFSLVGGFPASVAAGSNATFTVQLDATAVGTFSGNISFGNNDSNENPYNFAITGVVGPAPTPEINVTDGGFGGATNNITDGDTTPSTADGTDYGSTALGATLSRTFTIQNTGTAELTLSAPTLPTGFSLVGGFPTSIAAGGNATFTVQLDATTGGIFSGEISFGNNDSNENPYNFAITGTVIAPEINVTDGGFGGTTDSIADGDAAPSTDDGTDYGTTLVGNSVTRTFTIANTGTANLNLTTGSITIPAGYTITTTPSATVAPGASTTIGVQLTAAATGTFAGDIVIPNNDSDENPYNFAITGTVTAPEIDVTDGGFGGTTDSIADGDTTPSATDGTDYGSTLVGTAVTRTFAIANTGTSDLNLTTGSITVPAGYTITTTPSATVAPGGSTTIGVQLTAATAGTFAGDISIPNDDSDENPYNFAITGTVTAPEINVTDGGFGGTTDNITDGDTTPSTTDGTDYGSTPLGTAITRTFTIANTGTSDLNLTTGSITVPAGYTIATLPSATVAPGASTTIEVQLTATAAGTFAGDIAIPNDDSDENPYNFAITGTVIAPEINVNDGGFGGTTDNILDGDTTPSTTDGTDYGSTPLGTALTRTFTIENTGTANLNLTTGSITVPTGYTIATLPSATVAPGASTTIEVQLTATTVGTFAGDISIPNDDSNENPYNFAITGSVVAPEINVTVDDINGRPTSILDGDTTPSVDDRTDYGTTTVGTALTQTFTIENLGTAALTLGAPTLPTGFSLVGAFPTSIAAGSNAAFTVQLDATTPGTFNGEISFGNNDSDENPYNFAIAGIVTAPEINVTDGGFGGATDSIADGDTTPSTTDGTDYGTTLLGTAVSRTFAIANTGTATLNLTTGSITVPTGYMITSTPAATVAPGASTTITVQLTAGALGTFAGDIVIPNNDSDENPYNFAITGTVTAPEINVTDGGFGGTTDNIADGDATPSTTDGTDYGSTPVGTAVTRTFTIENTGTGTLNLTTGSITVPAGYTITTTPAATVAPGGSTTIGVQLTAATAGTFAGDISIPNDDSDENPYNFAITGSVVAPEINVTDGGFGGTTDNIADGDTTPSTTDGTDYGRTNVGATVSRTFTIENTGSAPLNLTTGSITVPTGYTITTLPSATVTPGASTTITVQLTAAASGTFGGDITIPNNDSNENPYNFAITGVVNAPPVLGAAAVGAITINEQTQTIISPTGLGITDDEPNAESATISITSGFVAGQDVLSVVGALPGGIVANTSVPGTITLTGSASLANYSTALHQIAYTNTSDNPNTATRTVSYTVNDGDVNSNTVTRDINVQPVNDPPALTPAPTYTSNANLTLTVPDGASDLLTGATDPDGTTVSVVAATLTSAAAAATATTADDNNVTVNADGSFTYNAVAGFVGSDTFVYQIQDSGTPLPPATANITATINVTDLDGAGAGNSVLWFIDEDAIDSANLGTQADPFRTLAAFNAANTGVGNLPANTDFIFIDDDATNANADGAGTYAGGITLRNDQKLIGDGTTGTTLAALTGITLGSFNSLDAFSGNRPNIAGGITLGSNNTLRGLNAGNASGFSITGGAVGNLTISEAIINNTTGGGFNVGTSGALNVVLGSLSSSGGTNGVNLVGSSGTFTANGGTITSPTGAAFNINGGSVNTTYSGNITQANNAAAVSVSGGHTGTATFQTGTINATNGTGLQFNNADGTYNFNGTATLNGGDAGIDIIGGSGGTFAFSANTSINNPSGIAYNEDTSTANVTYNGTITKTNNANNAVNINAKTGGTTTFNGQITGTTTTANAIDLTNTGGTVNFTGGLTLNTTSGVGFNATGGGTVSATGTNTITSTTGTALNVANTTIGASNLNFRSISSNGATNGIVLNNTGTSGGLTVTGTGSTAGSGGTIQNSTDAGILLTNTANVNLSNMNISGGGDDGIRGTTVTGLSLTGVRVTNNGNAAGEAGIDLTNLFGTSTWSGITVSGSAEDNAVIRNSSGTLTNLTVTGSTFSNNSAIGNDGFLMDASGTATMTATLTGNTFTANRGDHFQAAASNSANLNVKFTNNTLSGGHPTALGQGITINAATGVAFGGYTGRVNYDIDSNTINGAILSAITANLGTSGAAGTFNGFIRNNNIGTAGTPLSGSTQASGIVVEAHGNGTHTSSVTGNTVINALERGISVQANDGNGVLNLTVQSNDLDQSVSTNPLSLQSFFLNNASTTTNVFGAVDSHTVRLNFGGAGALANTLTNSAGTTDDFRIRQRFNSRIEMPGYSGTPFDTAAVVTYIQGRNTGSAGEPGSATANDSATVTTDGFFGGTVPTPTPF
ncbi:choice-of-anchor D domain-containing protein [Pseudanabaena sp. PCC 6802]|uniref:choice-of-anchor D domain-containing protein n=1 Tax=Pseudanabaena sp. PCC 6802 TaxID=118173 RepID=UPI000345AD7A|nr:choice-of-anchor D domain-containing protein [Pseudanabaena sp. PCC 6802]